MKVIALLSGGMDSTVLVHHLLSGGHDVNVISVDYGQRHKKEIGFASRLSEDLGIEHAVADLSSITHLLVGTGSSQVSDVSVPYGHYAADNMKTTVVPNRNMIMLSVAVGWGISLSADAVAYAAHAGDHTIYPDCRREFTDALNEAIRLCDWHQIELWRPFVHLSKTDIVKRGVELGVDFSKTWSCYEGKEIHCGQCGTCYERREAFQEAGVKDPTDYVSMPEYDHP